MRRIHYGDKAIVLFLYNVEKLLLLQLCVADNVIVSRKPDQKLL